MNNVSFMSLFKEISRNGLGAPLLVILTLGMMILPMPPLALDMVFTFNIMLALVVLLVSVYTSRPLDFSAFPTVLLVATMLRLALNIASTRVVLLEGHTGTAAAGNVIESFGDFVVGGNYAVGLVVFAILVIINFVVVTKGAGRVSEVSARFTLDAMPGKQMAVDADLNAGLITQDEARVRRREIAQEADFYGSMDGASKFVKGDAVAGILILFINIFGGLAIGLGQHGLSFSQAVENYSLLTIGDGLVAQVPSLLLSTATAIIVTRVSSKQDMTGQMMDQMFTDNRALLVTGLIIGLMGLIPGMPNVVFLSLSAGAFFLAWKIANREPQAEQEEETTLEEEIPEENRDLTWQDVKSVDIIGLEVGYKLIPLVDRNQDGAVLGRIKGIRRKLSEELGFLVPPVHIKDNLDLPSGNYRITVSGVAEGEATIHPDRELSINPGTVYGNIDGIDTRDPAFGMEAVWIEPSQRDYAQTLGYTVVDPGTVIATHMSKILHDHAADLLGYEEVQQLLDKLAETSPKLVEDLVPKTLPLSTVVKVLQNLLSDGIPIRDMRSIAETLAEQANISQDADALTSAVRVSLRRLITQQINNLDEEIPVITLDPELEQLLHQSLQNGQGAMTIEPGLAERVNSALHDAVQRMETQGSTPVLLVAPPLRPWIARLMQHSQAALKVLAYNEIAENRQIRVIASIGQGQQAPGLQQPA
ncbi:MAG: flagellar biosynthesis protein FlhA [bacterium]